MYFIDTNIFLRALIDDHKTQHKDTIAFLRQIKMNSQSAVTAGLVLAEIAWTLKSYYGLTRKEVATSLYGIHNLRGLRIVDSYNYSQALEQYTLHNVKYIDTVIASIPEVADKTWCVISYDTDFDKLNVIRKEPGEVIQN